MNHTPRTRSFLKKSAWLGVAVLVVVLADCSSKKDQGTAADSTAQSIGSATQDPTESKHFIQDTPEAKYADSLYSRFLRDNPTYYKEKPMTGRFLKTEVVSNQLVDIEKSPGTRVLQAVVVFNHGDVAGQTSEPDKTFIDLYARLLILEVKDQYVSLLADKDIDIPKSDPAIGMTHNVSFVNYRVTPNNDAIGVESKYRKAAYGIDQQRNELTLFIVMENTLTEVLKTTVKDSRKSFAPGAGYDPDNDKSKEVELKVFGAATMGLFDLLESTESKGARQATSNSVRTYRWSGARYE